jgi:hypothetical protein
MINNLTSYFKPDGTPTVEGLGYFRGLEKASGGAGVAVLPAAGEFIGNGLNATALGTQAQVANRTIIAPFRPLYSVTVDQFGASISAFVAGTIKFVVFDADSSGRPTTMLFESGTIDSGTSNATRFVTVSPFSFTAGKAYWLGLRSSANTGVRTLGVGSAPALTYTNAGTPAIRSALIRTQTHADAATDWTYAASQHSNALVPLILMRVA